MAYVVLICLDLKNIRCNVAYDIKTNLNYTEEELNMIKICKNTVFAINVFISYEDASFKGIQRIFFERKYFFKLLQY